MQKYPASNVIWCPKGIAIMSNILNGYKYHIREFQLTYYGIHGKYLVIYLGYLSWDII